MSASGSLRRCVPGSIARLFEPGERWSSGADTGFEALHSLYWLILRGARRIAERPAHDYASGLTVGLSSAILASRPLTNDGDASVDRSCARRTASLIATPSGTSSAQSSS
jgi:hypothetical protein